MKAYSTAPYRKVKVLTFSVVQVAAADANQDGVVSYNEFVPVLRELMQALPMPDVLPSKPRAGLSVDTGFQPGMSVERDIDNTWYPAARPCPYYAYTATCCS